MPIDSAEELTEARISNMFADELINALLFSFDIEDDLERLRLQTLMALRAKDLRITREFSALLKGYQQKNKALEDAYALRRASSRSAIPLKRDGKGNPLSTIDNILLVMQSDDYYRGVFYNRLTNSPEIHESENIRRWNSADEADSRHYLEAAYGIYSENKHRDALKILFREREYHPVQDIINAVEWDGVERCEHFLTEWANADDTPYVREVSRLIFAGGIHRLYLPGCKFDNVPVLIGTNQGEGKSTLVRWLAVHDQYFAEVTEMDGQRGIEQLEGAWICEIAELLALTRTKEQEAVKSYITRQRDKYRRPYDSLTSEYPRQCIFIGTTNNEQFLKDKTGNRRFFPVRVRSSGYELYDHEQECRDYILQCWAEARAKLLKGVMPAAADRSLRSEFERMQDEAMEDDWRIGAVEAYLNKLSIGDIVCIRQIKHHALCPPDGPKQDPTPKESQELTLIMGKMAGWERTGRIYTPNYGRQRCWRKASGPSSGLNGLETIPF